jgi:hypothetical protein
MAYDYNEDAMVSDRLEDRDASEPGEWKRPAGETQREPATGATTRTTGAARSTPTSTRD